MSLIYYEVMAEDINYEDVKICPECNAEFFAHIALCNGCGVELVRPGEELPQSVKSIPTISGSERDLVCVDQGDTVRLGELSRMLDGLEIPSEIVKPEGAGQGCGSGTLMLIVSAPLAEAAKQAIDEYWLKVHPELKDAHEREASDQCPACGAQVSATEAACSDCGLNLGGDEPPADSGNCGSC